MIKCGRMKTLYDVQEFLKKHGYITADLILRREHRLESEKKTYDEKNYRD